MLKQYQNSFVGDGAAAEAVVARVSDQACSFRGKIAPAQLLVTAKNSIKQGAEPRDLVDTAVQATHATANSAVLAIALLSALDLPFTDNLGLALCAAAKKNRQVLGKIREALVAAPWAKIIPLQVACPKLFQGSTNFALRLLKRIESDQASFPNGSDIPTVVVTLARQSWSTAQFQTLRPILLSFATNSAPEWKRAGFEALGVAGAGGNESETALLHGLDDPDPSVSRAAANAALRST
jgi:hypothetical protein